MKSIRTITLTLSSLLALSFTPQVAATDAQQAFMNDCLRTYQNESLCLGYALGVFNTISAIQCSQPEQHPIHSLTQSGTMQTEGAKRVRLSIEAMQPALSKISDCRTNAPASS
ncbi:hypothetical protein [Photobacterium salinisoli]|uniref:hypothetical protein n=1 Tax=Photobacterium salinisoli TaxID=1616783 RepID=UPI000EA08803|nr:hypothetical protein [Photobacterium salinisoli]